MAAVLKDLQEKKQQSDLDGSELMDEDIAKIELELGNAFKKFQIGNKTIDLEALCREHDYKDKFNEVVIAFNDFTESRMVGQGKRFLNEV